MSVLMRCVLLACDRHLNYIYLLLNIVFLVSHYVPTLASNDPIWLSEKTILFDDQTYLL
jgi:hypothetical protein